MQTHYFIIMGKYLANAFSNINFRTFPNQLSHSLGPNSAYFETWIRVNCINVKIQTEFHWDKIETTTKKWFNNRTQPIVDTIRGKTATVN